MYTCVYIIQMCICYIMTTTNCIIWLHIRKTQFKKFLWNIPDDALPKGCHLDMVGGPSAPHDPKRDAGGTLSSW
jgi:hypothetical protein